MERARKRDEIIEDYRIFLGKCHKIIDGMVNKTANLKHSTLTEGKFEPYTYVAMQTLGIITKDPIDNKKNFFKWTYGDDEITMELAAKVYDTATQRTKDLKIEKQIKLEELAAKEPVITPVPEAVVPVPEPVVAVKRNHHQKGKHRGPYNKVKHTHSAIKVESSPIKVADLYKQSVQVSDEALRGMFRGTVSVKDVTAQQASNFLNKELPRPTVFFREQLLFIKQMPVNSMICIKDMLFKSINRLQFDMHGDNFVLRIMEDSTEIARTFVLSELELSYEAMEDQTILHIKLL